MSLINNIFWGLFLERKKNCPSGSFGKLIFILKKVASRRARPNLPQNQLDNSNHANWTSAQLKEALKGLGINISIPLSRGNLKKLYLNNANNGVNEPVVSETDMPVTDCLGDAMLADSVSTDRGINLTNTTDHSCVESATITEHGTGNHIDATRSNPNINTSSSAHQFYASSDDMGKLIVNTLQLYMSTNNATIR